jgi:hypothetical protein
MKLVYRGHKYNTVPATKQLQTENIQGKYRGVSHYSQVAKVN